MRKTLRRIVQSRLRAVAWQASNYQSEPLSRVEMWLGVISVYLVLSAFLMGHFSAHTGAELKETVVPVSNRG